MSNSQLIEAYKIFISTALPYINIVDEKQYHIVLTELEKVFELSSDTKNNPWNPLIDMLSKAIEEYEMQDPYVRSFVQEANNLPTDLALLRTLMSSHNLTENDFPEIGDKSAVNKFFNGQASLSREAIDNLSRRFQLRPSMFLD